MIHALAGCLSLRRWFFPVLAAAAIFLIADAIPHGGSMAQEAPKGSPSQGNLKTVGEDGKPIKCSEVPEAKGGAMIGKIVPCVLRTIQTSATKFSEKMIEKFRPLLFAFLTLVIVLFGVKLVQNEGQVQAQAFVLIFKIGAVLTILALIPNTLIPTAYGIMAESQAVVMSALGPDESSMKCDISKYKGEQTLMIWAQLDCLVGQLFGFATGTDAQGNKTTNMLLASSMLGLLGGFFFSGTFGMILFAACISVLVSMFRLVLRVIMAFMNSYIFIALYMIMAPLIVPLMFLKVTTQIYDKWFSGIVAALLMPMVVSAYMVLALQMYDKLMFADDSLVKKLFAHEWIQKSQEPAKQLCDKQLTNNPAFSAASKDTTEKEVFTGDPFLKSITRQMTSSANTVCGGLSAYGVNLAEANKDDAKYKTQREIFHKLFRDCVKLFVLAMLIDMGFTTVQSAIRPMLGSGAAVASLDATMPGEQQLRQGMSVGKEGFMSAIVGKKGGEDVKLRDSSGKEFVQGLPEAFKKGVEGFMSGVQRK